MQGHGVYDGIINITNPSGMYNDAPKLIPMSPPDGVNRLVSQESAVQWDFHDTPLINFSAPGLFKIFLKLSSPE